MKQLLPILSLLITFFSESNAQNKSWYWSIRRCEIANPDDSAFLVNTEKQMWKASLTGTFPVYDGLFGGGGYRVRMSKAAADISFADTSINKLGFPGGWELATMWNHSADTFKVISFEPNSGVLSRTDKTGKLILSLETFCYAHIPLFFYLPTLGNKVFDRLHYLTLNSLSSCMNGYLGVDTIYRMINFRNDSNAYLPQSNYKHLAEMIQNGLYTGAIHGYQSYKRNKPMTKREIENSFVWVDSSNYVEYPANSGKKIYAPIQTVVRPVGVVLYERWIPVYNDNVGGFDAWPHSYITYHREVLAIGSRYTATISSTIDRVLWHNPTEVSSWLSFSKFSWSPYEESFRAERFQTMNIELYPY
jgi:hypothetical protein